jgi:hypothetical protein
MPSNRAAMLTPSPIRSPSLSSTTSPRWMPSKHNWCSEECRRPRSAQPSSSAPRLECERRRWAWGLPPHIRSYARGRAARQALAPQDHQPGQSGLLIRSRGRGGRSVALPGGALCGLLVPHDARRPRRRAAPDERAVLASRAGEHARKRRGGDAGVAAVWASDSGQHALTLYLQLLGAYSGWWGWVASQSGAHSAFRLLAIPLPPLTLALGCSRRPVVRAIGAGTSWGLTKHCRRSLLAGYFCQLDPPTPGGRNLRNGGRRQNPTSPVMRRLLYRTCYNRAPYPARYMLIPSRQGVCLLHRIGRPVISARDPAFMPRDMIQDCLDHVRLNTDISHSGRRRPARSWCVQCGRVSLASSASLPWLSRENPPPRTPNTSSLVLGCAAAQAPSATLGSHVVCRSWYAHPVTK